MKEIPYPYDKFLSCHGDELAAYSWLAYQKRGRGAVKVFLLFEPRGLELEWISRKAASQELRELIDNCDFEKETVAVLPGKILISFQTDPPPPDCFKKYEKFLTVGGGVAFWRIADS